MKTDVPRDTQQSGEADSAENCGRRLSDSKSRSKNSDISAQNNDPKSSDSAEAAEKNRKNGKNQDVPKKKKKRNLWPLWAMIISFVLSVAVNVGSETVLDGSGAALWIIIILTLFILFVSVVFDMIGVAVTVCDIEPFLAMASRKVRGARTAVKLAKKADRVSSFCCDIVGDICGVVSGVCAASIAASLAFSGKWTFWGAVLVTAVVSTMTISFKAMEKKLAVSKANAIIFGVAKFLAFFKKDI